MSYELAHLYTSMYFVLITYIIIYYKMYAHKLYKYVLACAAYAIS